MKNKYVFVCVMLLAILLGSLGLTVCYVNSTAVTETSEDDFTVVTSFYPIYIACMNITDGIDGVQLENLSEPQTGCLHDFQMTPEDMKLLSTADAFVINGGGIESFMEEVAAEYPQLAVVTATEGFKLLAEDEEDVNAHAWMSVAYYRIMVNTIAQELAELDPEHADRYIANAAAYDDKLSALQEEQQELVQETAVPVILFHAAYAYVAMDYNLEAVYLLDLDEERQVSAGEVADVLEAIENDGVGIILAEELYGSSMGETVQTESDVAVLYLDPMTRGEYDKDSYLTAMQQNMDILREYLE